MSAHIHETDRQKIIELLRNKAFVQAVKAYRDASGASLSDAKEAVEQISEEIGLPRQKVAPYGDNDLPGPIILIGVAVVVILLVALFTR